MIIAIDFDGTIAIGTYPQIEGQRQEAGHYIRKLKQEGHYLIINTCRSGDILIEAINWMLSEGIPFDRINDNHPEETARYNNNSRKVHADLYIDDKQIGGLPQWEEIYEYITKINKQ